MKTLLAACGTRRQDAEAFGLIFKLETRLAIGTVKWFNAQKGYGFIRPDDGGKDVFVHISAVERAGMGGLAEGQKVKYDVAVDRGKPAAANLAAAD
jgi:CspA family cold shock protein